MRFSSITKGRRAMQLLGAIMAVGTMGLSSQAAVFTYSRINSNTAGSADPWSAGTNWDSTPASAADTTLTFSGALAAGRTVFTDNDEIPLNGSSPNNFLLNQLNMNYSGPASSTAPTVTISGNPLEFVNNGATGPTMVFATSGTVKPTVSISNNLVLTNDLSITATTNATLSGVVSGASGLTMSSGSGIIVLSNVANTYTGVSTLNSGILRVGAVANVNTASSIGQGSVAGSAADLVFGGGTLQYNGSTNTSTDRLFTIGNANGNSATLDNSSTTNQFNFTGTGSIAFGTTGPHTLTLTGSTQTNPFSNGLSTFAPVISDQDPATGKTQLIKNGAAAWNLTGANTYSGGTSINLGVLKASNATANPFGTGDITVNALAQAWCLGATTYANNFTIAGNGPNSQNLQSGVGGNLGAILVGPGATVSGTITLAANSSITARNHITSTSVATVSGKITGNFDIMFGNGSGLTAVTLVISNPANDWTGNTSFQAQNIDTGNSGGNNSFRLDNSNVIPSGAGKGNVTMSGGSGTGANTGFVINLNGTNQTFNGLNSSGLGRPANYVITNSSTTAAASLTLGGNDQSGTFRGTFSDGGTGLKSLALTKIGAGTQTLTGVSTHRGTTTITGGTVVIDYNTVGTSATNTPGNYFSTASDIVLNGGTLAINGRGNGTAVTKTAVSTSAHPTLTLDTTAGLVPGQRVDGVGSAGVPAGAYISVILSATQIELNANTTAANATIVTDNTSGSTSQNFQSLALNASSHLDFGNGGNGNTTVITVLGAISNPGGSTLTIDNWNGVADTGGGTERLMFTGADASAFIAAFPLQNQVVFTGFDPGYTTVQTGSLYEIVPVTRAAVPEPASLMLLGLGGVALLARRRRSL